MASVTGRKFQTSWHAVGGLSRPSKMPGYAYSLPASACLVGAQLARIPGSVCSSCYALRGRYTFPNVQRAMQRRLDAIYYSDWSHHMAILINATHADGHPYFRWHDSGDLQGEGHLRKIVEVAMATPKTHHWLPTRETGIIHKFLNGGGNFPFNLTVRISTLMIDAAPPAGVSLPYVTSTVSSKSATPIGYRCPASTQGNNCGSCRACWNRKIQNVDYLAH